MTRLLVVHGSYGCDTGCCGHYVQVEDGPEPERIEGAYRNFNFSHPFGDDDRREFAEDMIRSRYGEDHVKDLDWEHCIVLDD